MSTLTVTAEPTILLRDVRRRAAPVLALVAARCWPGAELRVLARYLRATALCQVADEPAAEQGNLVEHTERLEKAGATTCPLRELSGLVEATLSLLGARTGSASHRPRTRATSGDR